MNVFLILIGMFLIVASFYIYNHEDRKITRRPDNLKRANFVAKMRRDYARRSRTRPEN
jgi:hypothetical protein